MLFCIFESFFHKLVLIPCIWDLTAIFFHLLNVLGTHFHGLFQEADLINSGLYIFSLSVIWHELHVVLGFLFAHIYCFFQVLKLILLSLSFRLIDSYFNILSCLVLVFTLSILACECMTISGPHISLSDEVVCPWAPFTFSSVLRYLGSSARCEDLKFEESISVQVK